MVQNHEEAHVCDPEQPFSHITFLWQTTDLWYGLQPPSKTESHFGSQFTTLRRYTS